jgi:hypothetical protein
MRVLALTLLLCACATGTSTEGDPLRPTSYRSAKTIAMLEQCLTSELAALGDVTTISMEGTKTVMVRDGKLTPMLIELAPPAVTVTTKIQRGSRHLIEGCL